MTESTDGPSGARATVTVVNKKGLHARPAAMFARVADGFDADIVVSVGAHSVSANSIMGLLTLGAARGAQMVIVGNGPDAEAAVAALARLVENHFEEEDFPGY